VIPNKVAGAVDGVVVQARDIQGDVYVGGSARVPVPWQVPPPGVWVDRDVERAEVGALLDRQEAGTPVVVLAGMPGVGKSALAARVLVDRADQYPNGLLYAHLTRPDTVAPAQVLGRFLRALGVPATAVPDDEAERVALWRSMSAVRRVAVLLDAPASSGQVAPLLPGSAGCAVIVTARGPMPGLHIRAAARVLDVRPMDHDAALALLRAYLGDRVDAEPDAAADLARWCGGLPVALAVLAASAAARPRRSLSRTATELAANRLEMLSVDDADLSTRAALEDAYRGLPEPAARAYRALGMIPGVEISVELAAAAIGADLDQAEDLLDELHAAALLLDAPDGVHRFQALVGEHARSVADRDEGPSTRRRVLARVLGWYLLATRAAAAIVMPARRVLPLVDTVSSADLVVLGEVMPAGLDGYDRALAWLDRHRRDLGAAVHAAAAANRFSLAVGLADAMQPLALLHKDRDHAIEVDTVALDAALRVGDPGAVNAVRMRLARAHLRRCDETRGDLARAGAHYEQALADSIASGDPAAVTKVLKGRAELLLATGETAAGIKVLLEVASVRRDLGEPRGEALALIVLAEALIGADRPEEALGHGERARDLLAELAGPDPYNRARADLCVARAHCRIGDTATAWELAGAALDTMTRVGSPEGQIHAHEVFAEIARAVGDLALADEYDALVAALRATPPGIA
jgi:tetratricopeptide (TPR) repeat protein